MTSTRTQARIEADEKVPMIHIYRDFAATPAQLFRAHTDPELFARWVGPTDIGADIDYWDARDGGAWRYTASRGEEFSTAFRGCFHTVSPERIVQTFTWEGMPEHVALETLTLTDLGDGLTQLRIESLTSSFADRDAWLSGGMQTGVEQGYAKLDALLGADV